MLTRSTYLVTGRAGVIGSALCERLLAAGADVPCVEVDGIFNLACPASPRHCQLSDES